LSKVPSPFSTAVRKAVISLVWFGLIATTPSPYSTSDAYTGGPRLDYPSDSTREGADCWVDGYDAGFAGRADECANEDNEYNRSWDYACRDGGHTEDECNGFKDNPVEIENHESLQQENTQACFNDGRKDGEPRDVLNTVVSTERDMNQQGNQVLSHFSWLLYLCTNRLDS
jgi:hypothetical protein